MHTPRGAASILLLMAACTAPPPADVPPPTPHALAAVWDGLRTDRPAAPLLTPADVERQLRALHAGAPEVFAVEEIGRSVEGRPINSLRFGRGGSDVLLWSQMHGDEPTATAALLDLFEYVRRRPGDPIVERLLARLTVHAVPMLNPDGAERFTRRNAQGIDINRDALMLQTPEGRALKALRDRIEPRLALNLHNQSWRTSVGSTGRPATISLLAVAYDEARSESEGRLLTKRLAALVRDGVEAFAPGHVAKYDDSFEPRAFGDNITRWGTPVLLVETGAWPGPDADRNQVRLNFVVLATALDALASDRVASADPGRYDSLPMNGANVLYQLVRGARVITGTGVPPFSADIGIVAERTIRTTDGRRRMRLQTRIEEFGDLSTFGAIEVIEAQGLTAAPLFDSRLQPGDVVALPPSWPTGDMANIVADEQPANFVLLRPRDDGRYTVDRIFADEADERVSRGSMSAGQPGREEAVR